MKEQIKRLYEEAGGLHKRATDILNEYEGKEMPAEKAAEVDTLLDQVEGKTAEAKRLERVAAADRELSEPVNRLPAPQVPVDDTPAKGGGDVALKAYGKAIRNGIKSLDAAELKALAADDPAAGGYLTVPVQEVEQVLVAVKDLVYMRQLATVFSVPTAQSLGVASIETDLTDATWTSELLTGSADTVKPFGRRELRPHPLAKSIKISRKLLRVANQPIEAIVRDRLAYRFAVPQENAFMTGTGVDQPLGVFTASNNGISTGRDTTAAAATSLAADDFINTFYSLKPQYMARATWIVNRAVVKALRKLKTGDGEYIWQPGLADNQAPTIVGRPFVMSEYAPGTITSGKYVAIVGDFKAGYWIADALDMQIQVVNELYAETNQIGYIGRMETDGQPVLEEAFARLITA